MNTRNIKQGFVTVRLQSSSNATAYIREYEIGLDGVPQARCMVNGNFIQASWNGMSWVQAVPLAERGQLNGDRAWSLLK